MADEHSDTFGNELDRLEKALEHREAELQRLRTELALKTLYAEELQATLEAQARELEAFDARLRRMESRVSAELSAPPAAEPFVATINSNRPAPLLIRIRRSPGG